VYVLLWELYFDSFFFYFGRSTTIISSLFPDRLEMVLEPIIW
jgi:hypothetical protein